MSESAHVFSLQHPSTSVISEPVYDRHSISPGTSSRRRTSTASSNPPQVPLGESTGPLPRPPSRRGLYGKSKWGLAVKLKFRADKEACLCPSIPECDTTNDRVESRHLFAHLTKAGPWFKDESGTSKIKRKLFGKAPWHRKESGDSFSTVASSVREVLRGETPPSTPMSDLAFTFGGKYANTQFPGGEAVRVKTPPIGEYTADGRPRGFFTSMTPPSGDGAEHVSVSMESSRHIGHRRSLIPQSRDWWECYSQKPLPQESVRQDIYDHAAPFEFQIPEHLPSSPMCPTNTKHQSGGTGLCVYHGRRRAGSYVKGVARGDLYGH